jgi:hypothetical protein
LGDGCERADEKLRIGVGKPRAHSVVACPAAKGKSDGRVLKEIFSLEKLGQNSDQGSGEI